jgi:hypothetical protein
MVKEFLFYSINLNLELAFMKIHFNADVGVFFQSYIQY